ncbi:glycosyltransferase [Thermovenabulum sp.]|uniref:glycosyltransferase n=1 Tax=Thermovenabulum sp. TaxID=3100335 RepID=UPI003C7A1444
MVSLILTTLNEEQTITLLLKDILMQTRKPDELVIVDGGSTDRTVDLIREYSELLMWAGIRIVIKVLLGANIARGRNEAISIAKGPYIVVTDAGCRLDPKWIERLVEPLEAGRADFVGGFYRPVAHSRFQEVLASLTTSTHPTPNFLPSSRSVAFTKTLWQRVGGYPEWLPWGEDTLFDCLCLKTGARYVVVADAVVYWEVRSSFRAAIKQHFRYAFGDGLAARFSSSHLVLQGIYWTAIFSSLILEWWLLLPIFLYPFIWIIRRKVIKITNLPLAYTIAFCIQASRFFGFIWGLVVKLFLKEAKHENPHYHC